MSSIQHIPQIPETVCLRLVSDEIGNTSSTLRGEEILGIPVITNRIRTKQDFNRVLLEYSGRISCLWIETHGHPDFFKFSDGIVHVRDIEDIFKGVEIIPNGMIMITSCCAGGENLLAKRIHEVTKRTVFAAENEDSYEGLILRDKGSIKLVNFNKNFENITVTFHADGRVEHDKGRDCLAAAADQRYPMALYELAKSGISGQHFNEAAAEFWKSLNNPKHDSSVEWIGWKDCCQGAGQKVKYPPKAMADFERDAAKGNVKAQIELATGFCEGEWGFQDFFDAAKWFEKAAMKGNQIAQYHYGMMILTLLRDVGGAKKWLERSAAQGNADAVKALKGL